MPSVVARRPDVTSTADVLLEGHHATEFAQRGLVRLCAAGFVAYCSDAICRTPLLVSGALVFATVPFTYLGVSTLAALIMLRVVHGSATAIFGPVASASLSDIATPSGRGAWLSTYSTAQGAGQAVGPILGGI